MSNLSKKCKNRNYNPNPIATEKLLEGIDNKLLKDYIPTEEAIKENRDRISLRLKKAAQRKG